MSSSYLVYRNGKTPDGLGLKEALTDFYRRFGALPVAVIVHKSQVDQVQAALTDLDLSRLPVRCSGGCLANEVWLAQEARDERG